MLTQEPPNLHRYRSPFLLRLPGLFPACITVFLDGISTLTTWNIVGYFGSGWWGDFGSTSANLLRISVASSHHRQQHSSKVAQIPSTQS
ncbi:hypothetical protein BV898_03112 [Hypsibius exemplaris]|uniref:Uncharacterized protein n=1 Tax=Hypsibius exemplaris TaxID=2072580 RepID=A0A1W0X6E9_HYPEX|nr:hypothetical protein BV898_03112 [Hypsibius exemplaris]